MSDKAIAKQQERDITNRYKAVDVLRGFEEWLKDEPKQHHDDHAKCALWDAADKLQDLKRKYGYD